MEDEFVRITLWIRKKKLKKVNREFEKAKKKNEFPTRSQYICSKL